MANNQNQSSDRSTPVTTSEPTPAPAPAAPTASMSTEQMLAATLAALAESNKQNAESNRRIADLMEQQGAYNKEALRIAPRRKKTMGEYLAERKKRGAGKRLLHDVYQNGRLVNPSGLSDETIALLDTLNTGKYCDGLVDVVRIRDGAGGIASRIHLMYNNKNDMEKMAIYMRFPTFTKMVTDIAAEMAVQGISPVHETPANPVEIEFPESL